MVNSLDVTSTVVPPEPLASSILIVDDSPANLLAVESALSDFAGNLLKAHSGAEALRCLLETDVALILLDVQMPSMDGFQTARLIRERSRTRHTPIIFLTAYDRDQSEVMRAYQLGAVDFLYKPVVPEILRAKVAVFVELRQRQDELARQAELIRQHERREHERVLAEERQRWQEQALRREMEEERRLAEAMTRKAQELAGTVARLTVVERELKQKNLELADADRRKDEFLAVLAHELRNPLAPIMTSLDVMRLTLGKHPEPGPLPKLHQAMERQLYHLRRLVDDLLDVSRISSGRIELRLEQLDLRTVLEEAMTTSEPLISGRQQRLEAHLPAEPVWVDGDPVRLTQVVSNLLNNAARYTEPGGHIWLDCRREGDRVRVSVRDDGRGISPELLPRVFQLFVQERQGGGGLGIGLTLVKQLTEMHGGHVDVHSEGAGKGSVFSIELPALAESEVLERERLSSMPEVPAAPLRVVLIEDNADIREAVSELLRAHGHQVHEAEDGVTGVAVVRDQRPDVALVDIGLPLLDGCGVAERLRRDFPPEALRLIAMTGYGQPKDRERIMSAGFDAHLVKPASAASLLAALAPAPPAPPK